METERPVRNFCGCSNNLGVLPSHLSRVRRTSSKEVEIQNTSNDVILQTRPGGCLVDFDVHSVGVQQEDSVCPRRAVLKVNGVVPVQVTSGRYSVCIARPERARRVRGWEAETVRVFSETIDVCIVRQIRFHTQVLRFEYDGM